MILKSTVLPVRVRTPRRVAFSLKKVAHFLPCPPAARKSVMMKVTNEVEVIRERAGGSQKLVIISDSKAIRISERNR